VISSTNGRITWRFVTLVERHAEALIVGDFTYFERSHQKIIELAGRHKIPAIYHDRAYPVEGGLMSYDADPVAVLRQLGADYVGQILKGTKPADLCRRLPFLGSARGLRFLDRTQP
jgi:putative tryptophan/tyrosine transport system substrate-binding protein